MFESCQNSNAGPKCSEVAEKIVQLFGWRQTYKVEKLQRHVPDRSTTRISITRPSPQRQHLLSAQEKLNGGADAWVSVHNLQSTGGGILDPDDRLNDVADDREQILASFDDGDGAHHHGGGDGASGSSVGTGSPDLFQDGDKYGPSYPRTDIEVTGEQIANGLGPGPLQVRRGSEPALNQLPVGPPAPSEHTKRWSAAPIILEPPNVSYLSPDWSVDEKDDAEDESRFQRVPRDGSSRLSMQFLGDGAGYRWAEAAEKAANARAHTSTSLPREIRRKEPLGQANSSSVVSSPGEEEQRNSIQLIVIRNEPGPLGIHVVPDYDRLGKDRGLLVQGIEPNGRIDRDGRLANGDRIIEINGQNLLNMPFQRVQEMFKLSLIATELRLKVIKHIPMNSVDQLRKPPAPVYPRFPEDKENVAMVEVEQKLSTNTKVATVSPTKKVPAGSRNLKTLLIANTRKIGKKIEIDLIKGPHGLGFSITTRDNPAGGNCPIYIKNIIPKGAAIEDGRLKIGDRLLEVNNVEMTGKSQAEAVSILRNVPTGGKVKIVVSRQEEVAITEREIGADSNNITNEEQSPPKIPPLPNSQEKTGSVARIVSQFQDAVNNSGNSTNNPDKSDDSLIFPWKHREILTLNIPVHDSEKAGLGISVKGKTTSGLTGSQDLGIFIKSVIHGGAASRDKRLRTNDQLLNVNGISLLAQSNSDAMETLRKAMLHTEGPVPGNITLTIARRASSPAPPPPKKCSSNGRISNSSSQDHLSNDTDASTTDNSGTTSASSSNTVIFKQNLDNDSSISPHSMNNQSLNKSLSSMDTWNPVLDRLTGRNPQLRNESYYMATNDTWNSSTMTALSDKQSENKFSSPTINNPPSEPILIEDEYNSRHLPPRPRLTTTYLENRNETEPDGKASFNENVNKSTDKEMSPPNLTNGSAPTTDVTYASQLSLENPAGFSRDAVGRQSMSEKRHATLDAKSTGTYQRTKKLREERTKDKHGETNLLRVGSMESVISVNRSPIQHPEYADKLGQLGPSLGMKKSSSLESLQTMVQEMQMQEEGDPSYSYRGPGALKVIRGRGCDESFRAAVDTSYKPHLMDPNHRSETSAKKHWLLDPPIDYNERDIDGFTNVRGGPRQSSLNAVLDSKHKTGKKKPGIFKGIGHMFRFGKHRKMESIDAMDENLSALDENAANDNDSQINKEIEKQKMEEDRLNEQRSQEMRIQEHQEQYQRLVPRHKHQHQEHIQIIPENGIPSSSRYHGDMNGNENQRIDRVHHLRHLHQQKHAERQGHYPHDEREEHYEQVIRQRLEQGPNNYGEGGRPGSRSGITEPIRFTHYVNYDELQHHLSSNRKDHLSENQIVQMRLQVQQQRLKVEEESRKQHQYHSQRQPRMEPQPRPVSNFYEYESVQGMMQPNRIRSGNVPPPYIDVPRQGPPRNLFTQQHARPYQQFHHQQHRYQRHNQSQRGPFVTQVTIGEQINHSNGSKV